MLSVDEALGVEVALNEADWTGIGVDEEARSVRLSFRVLSLSVDPNDPAPDRVSLLLTGVSRLAVSVRAGRWDDRSAPVLPVSIVELPAVLESFGGTPIYGWDFVDPPEDSWEHWRDRLSLDRTFAADEAPHVLDLFQDVRQGPARFLDARIWFSDLAVSDFDGEPIPLDDFIAAGRRWWDGLYSGDPRTAGEGIVPTPPPAVE